MIKSVVTERTNGALIASAARLWIRPNDQVMDVTYGRGKWWTVFRPADLIMHDRYKLDGVDFRNLPEEDGSIDVVAFDPPYAPPGGRKTSTVLEMHDRYGQTAMPKTPQETRDLIADGMTEIARVLAAKGRVMAKVMDYITGGHFHQGHHHLVSTAHWLGLVQLDEFIHVSGTGPQPSKNRDGSVRRQVHTRRNHTFLCVFEKPKPARKKHS